MATYKDENAEEVFARIFTYFVVLSIFVGLGISALVKDVLQIIATQEEYLEAYRIVPFIVFAYIIFGFYYHFSMGIYISKKTHYLAYIDIANAFLNLGLNYILIQRYLAWGAVAATIICFIFRSGATWVLTARTYPIRFEWTRVGGLFLWAALLYWITTLVDLGSPWLNLPVKGLIALSYPVVLFFTGFFDKSEKAHLQELWAWAWAQVLRREA